MCFSATASFSAGAVLLGIGALTLKAADRPREWALAAIPLLFAIQQLSEGVIWLTFSYEAPGVNTFMTHLYSLFSHVLWPAYVPMAVLLIEPPGRRWRGLLGLSVVGVAVGGYLLYFLFAFPVIALPTGQHIEYVSPHFFAAATMSLYLVATSVTRCCRAIARCGCLAFWRCCRLRRRIGSTRAGSFRYGAFLRRC